MNGMLEEQDPIITEVITKYKGNTKIIIRVDSVTVKVKSRDNPHIGRLVERAHHIKRTKNYKSTMRSKVQIRPHESIYRMHLQNASRSRGGDRIAINMTGPIEIKFDAPAEMPSTITNW